MKRYLFALAATFAATFLQAVELPGDLSLELIAEGFSRPVAVADSGDGDDRLFVVEQNGRILVVDGGEVLENPFLDIASQVESSSSEQGLLGLAFHPNFQSNGLFYINYTFDPAGGGPDVTRISRFEVSNGDPNMADHGSEEVLLEFDQDFSNHNGGWIAFGPDGFLYIATGDGGSGGDPNNRAQDLDSLLGKLLRIDVDGGDPYAIPVDNPFVDLHAARPEIWAYGLRNPWRFSFDRSTGDLFIGDVGQGAVEEIDFQIASSDGGENYGWSCMEGDRSQNYNPCDGSPLTDPILVYGHNLGCSVTGGFRYRGNITSLRGFYVFGDFCSGRIWFASEEGIQWVAEEWANTGMTISSFGEDKQGELFVVAYGRGEVYRLVGPVASRLRRTPGRRVAPAGSGFLKRP